MSSLTSLVAAERRADLIRAAERRLRLVGAAPAPAPPRADRAGTVALRLAHADEASVIAHLAELDDAPAPVGDVLLALVDGDAIAALSLEDGHVVADPFTCTVDAVALLRLRARHLGYRLDTPEARLLIPRLRRA